MYLLSQKTRHIITMACAASCLALFNAMPAAAQSEYSAADAVKECPGDVVTWGQGCSAEFDDIGYFDTITVLHTADVSFENGNPVYMGTNDKYTGSVRITCDKNGVAIVGGSCMKNCLETKNHEWDIGCAAEIQPMRHGASREFDNEIRSLEGATVALCYDGNFRYSSEKCTSTTENSASNTCAPTRIKWGAGCYADMPVSPIGKPIHIDNLNETYSGGAIVTCRGMGDYYVSNDVCTSPGGYQAPSMEEKEEIAAEVMQEMQEMLETDGGSEDEPPAIVRCGGTMIGGTPPAECFSVRK